MNKKEITICCFLITIIGIICYFVGFSAGILETINIVIEAAPNILDIELSERALSVLMGNPAIFMQMLTPESMEKYLGDLEYSAELKGGLGPNWNLYSQLEDTLIVQKNSSET